ncbi:MAG: SRPBCC family protein [Bacillota bacterium]|nr:SRPBCC family protein [Bacillota bacterium]MDW7678159.1 SRPBCC family protein [Bacillota bacterium]
MKTVTVERVISTPPEKVWAFISNFADFPGNGNTVVINHAGDPKAYGAGTIRTITNGNRQFVERIETIDPPHAFTYSLLSGAPVKEYHGRAEFNGLGNKTKIRWSGTFKPALPGTGWILAWITRKIIQGIIADLEKV